MAKLLKETPVHITCPACGKTQRAKLKWAKNHKSLQCKDCGKNVDLREKQVHSMIARTLKAVELFEHTLDSLHDEAKRAGKAVKAKKPKKSKEKKKAKKAGKKAKAKAKPATKAVPSKPVSMMPVSPAPAGGNSPA
jgi:predicted RNA-binding Zn-ribbon protein involved in translation (DUF1610 family)